MNIATRQQGNSTLVDVNGDIDLYNSPEVRKIILEEFIFFVRTKDTLGQIGLDFFQVVLSYYFLVFLAYK